MRIQYRIFNGRVLSDGAPTETASRVNVFGADSRNSTLPVLAPVSPVTLTRSPNQHKARSVVAVLAARSGRRHGCSGTDGLPLSYGCGQRSNATPRHVQDLPPAQYGCRLVQNPVTSRSRRHPTSRASARSSFSWGGLLSRLAGSFCGAGRTGSRGIGEASTLTCSRGSPRSEGGLAPPRNLRIRNPCQADL